MLLEARPVVLDGRAPVHVEWYGITPADPLTFASVAFGPGCVDAVACDLPARRALSVPVADVLRLE